MARKKEVSKSIFDVEYLTDAQRWSLRLLFTSGDKKLAIQLCKQGRDCERSQYNPWYTSNLIGQNTDKIRSALASSSRPKEVVAQILSQLGDCPQAEVSSSTRPRFEVPKELAPKPAPIKRSRAKARQVVKK